MKNLTTTAALKLDKIIELQKEWHRIDNWLTDDRRDKEFDEMEFINLELIEAQLQLLLS